MSHDVASRVARLVFGSAFLSLAVKQGSGILVCWQ